MLTKNFCATHDRRSKSKTLPPAGDAQKISGKGNSKKNSIVAGGKIGAVPAKEERPGSVNDDDG
ncbi:MAG TPA: hypothetical protein QF772_04700, partial [Nitrospinaceae bacterium]|nr:hypothetical protein [Nitrospinaceae bacterium]